MPYLAYTALALTIIGAFLSIISRKVGQRGRVVATAGGDDAGGARWSRGGGPGEPPPSGNPVLIVFCAIAALFLGFLTYRFWDEIVKLEVSIYFAFGLFLMMVAGMFVNVIKSNYGNGKPLFEVTAAQLIFPVLFAPMVFYPIWIVATSGKDLIFPLYAAFLNGYFWESVVSSVKGPPKG